MIIIRNAKILTMAGTTIENGSVSVDSGKIIAIAEKIEFNENDTIIDAKGQYLLPGFIDAHCHIGLWEDGMGNEGADGNEATDPITPDLRAIDAINPFDKCFEEAYMHGVTTAITGPGSANVICGQFVALKTLGNRPVEEMIIKSPIALKTALGENPKSVYGEQKKSPSTRMATAALFRQSFLDAQAYMDTKSQAEAKGETFFNIDLKKEPLAAALRGELQVKIHAHRADDILTAIRLANEFKLNYTIDHCTEGYMMPDYLLKEDAKIIIGPLICDRCKIELKNLSYSAPKILEKKGIKFAIMTDHPVIPIQFLPVEAAIAVREGLSEEEALKAITINPAEIVGISDRVGSIEIGKDADLVLHSGHPFDIRSKVTMVMIDGQVIHIA